MKTFKKMHAQGDVILIVRPMSAIPKDAKEVDRGTDGHVIAHSETGHHHVVRNTGVAMFEVPDNPLVCYLRLDAGCAIDVEHIRDYDTHELLHFEGKKKSATVIEVRRQREWAPEGWRRAVD